MTSSRSISSSGSSSPSVISTDSCFALPFEPIAEDLSVVPFLLSEEPIPEDWSTSSPTVSFLS